MTVFIFVSVGYGFWEKTLTIHGSIEVVDPQITITENEVTNCSPIAAAVRNEEEITLDGSEENEKNVTLDSSEDNRKNTT